jgi:RNA polymerase sigma-70 factor (ECF subfamily)
MKTEGGGHQADPMAANAAAKLEPTPAANPELVALYRAHFQFVWRSARRLGAPVEALDDVVQDVFLVVARRLAEFRREASARTWLFAITLRVVREHRRSTFRHLRRVQAYAEARPAEAGDAMARSDAARTLLQLLDGLDDDRRSVYVLAELEGLTAQEIADGLRLNVNTVYSRLRAARTQLERALAERGGT